MSEEPETAEMLLPFSPRRRFLLLVGPALVSLIGLLAVIVWENRHPSAWQVELDAYIAQNPVYWQQAPAVEEVLTARYPERFRPAMPFVAYSDSAIYQTGARSRTDELAVDGRRPLPFPVPEVWCIQLRNEQGADRPLLIVRHQDIYNGDWIVYEANLERPIASIEGALAIIGCPMKLQ